jgi:SAM-dependent methyltransferase
MRALTERIAFTLTPQYQSDTLPPIFDYWSSLYLSPAAKAFGIETPEAFYLDHILEKCQQKDRHVRVLSVGCGTATMEMELAERLRQAGHCVSFACMDFNPALMKSATMVASERGLSNGVRFDVFDCNDPFELPEHDVIVVNQFFHHVTELEVFCRSLCRSLAQDGVVVTSDVVGRNGHQLWPSALDQVNHFWSQLPPEKTFDRHTGKQESQYRSIDHAAYSNEGVRAQDVVACLMAEFDFDQFLTFGGAIMPFVERRVGFNFHPDIEQDRKLIRTFGAIDQVALEEGLYPPVNMIASLRHKGRVTDPRHSPITPDDYIERVRQQVKLVESELGD